MKFFSNFLKGIAIGSGAILPGISSGVLCVIFGIYEKLLNDKLSTNLGYVYENMVAQMLTATGKNLFYHTIPYAEGKKYYEVDFIITDQYKISPIEVKSSGYKTHKSLDQFCAKYSERIMNRYLIYTKDYKRENGVEYIPIYMAMFL